MEQTAPFQRHTAGNENTGFLKLIAIITMIIDHTGALFFNQRSFYYLRYIGRLAMPLFCWCMVVGACKSRNVYRYALRVLLTGVLSQPLYALTMHHSIWELNIFFTLFLGLTAIIGIRERKFGSHIWMPILAYTIACFLHIDYNAGGVLFLICLYLARKRKAAIAGVMVVMCLYWWQGDAFIYWLRMQITSFRTVPRLYVNRIQPYAIFSLPLILLPVSSSFHLPKWLGYSIYPLHLIILHGVDYLLK